MTAASVHRCLISFSCLVCTLGIRDSTKSASDDREGVHSDVLPHFISKNMVWLNYLLPSASLWDEIHDGHTVNDGGIWNYGSNVQSELEAFIEERHPEYNSAWDVACNIGYFLKRLASKHPGRRYFGSDISSVMVDSTKSVCTNCVVEVFDLSQLQYSNELPAHFPQTVDIIVVADVVFYMAWGGLPPIGNWIYPSFLVRDRQIKFVQHLAQRARKEVVFAAAQRNNWGVLRFFKDMGIQQIGHFWVVKGTASTGQLPWMPPNLQSSSMHGSLCFLLLALASLGFLVTKMVDLGSHPNTQVDRDLPRCCTHVISA